MRTKFLRLDLFSICRAFLNGILVAGISFAYLFFAWLAFEVGAAALGVILALLYLAFLLFSVVYVSLRAFQYKKALQNGSAD